MSTFEEIRVRCATPSEEAAVITRVGEPWQMRNGVALNQDGTVVVMELVWKGDKSFVDDAETGLLADGKTPTRRVVPEAGRSEPPVRPVRSRR